MLINTSYWAFCIFIFFFQLPVDGQPKDVSGRSGPQGEAVATQLWPQQQTHFAGKFLVSKYFIIAPFLQSSGSAGPQAAAAAAGHGSCCR